MQKRKKNFQPELTMHTYATQNARKVLPMLIVCMVASLGQAPADTAQQARFVINNLRSTTKKQDISNSAAFQILPTVGIQFCKQPQLV